MGREQAGKVVRSGPPALFQMFRKTLSAGQAAYVGQKDESVDLALFINVGQVRVCK